MSRNERDFCVALGTTFHPTLRWGAGTYTSKPITGISKAAPAIVTAVGHDLPNGWPCAVVGALGMTQINGVFPPQGADTTPGTVLGADTVQLDEVSSTAYSTYVSGGFLVYETPKSLAGVSISMPIYADSDYDGTPLVTLTSVGGDVTVDDTLKTITPLLQTAALAWKTGYYRVDATDGAGIVTELLRGIITIG